MRPNVASLNAAPLGCLAINMPIATSTSAINCGAAKIMNLRGVCTATGLCNQLVPGLSAMRSTDVPFDRGCEADSKPEKLYLYYSRNI